MNEYKIILLPGDGIGPEITQVTKTLLERVSKKYGFRINFHEEKIGGSAIENYGIPLTNDTIKKCKDSDAVLMAAIGNPKYDLLPRENRPESGLLKLRADLDLFANLRPVKVWPSLLEASSLKPELIKDVDLIVARELTSGIYFGKPKGRITNADSERAFNTMTYSSQEIDRIAKVGFELARARRGRLCSIDKANVLEVSQLWRERIELMANKYADIEVSHLYVDNAAMQLVKEPSQFDVIVTGNLFGDILSDEAAMLTGSIGMLPSASLSSEGPGLFEPVHGSAPDIAGQDKANPIAMVLSAAMMLRIGLKEEEAAEDLEKSINKVLGKGFRTSDLMNEGSIELSCTNMGEELLRALN